jgi:hypothetical protein
MCKLIDEGKIQCPGYEKCLNQYKALLTQKEYFEEKSERLKEELEAVRESVRKILSWPDYHQDIRLPSQGLLDELIDFATYDQSKEKDHA